MCFSLLIAVCDVTLRICLCFVHITVLIWELESRMGQEQLFILMFYISKWVQIQYFEDNLPNYYISTICFIQQMLNQLYSYMYWSAAALWLYYIFILHKHSEKLYTLLNIINDSIFIYITLSDNSINFCLKHHGLNVHMCQKVRNCENNLNYWNILFSNVNNFE